MFVNLGHILTKGLKSGLNYEPKSFQTLLNKLVSGGSRIFQMGGAVLSQMGGRTSCFQVKSA